MALFDNRSTTSAQLAHASAMVAGTLFLIPITGFAAPIEPRVGSLRQFKFNNPDLSRRDFRREFRIQRTLNASNNAKILNSNPAKNITIQNHELFQSPRERRANAPIRFANLSTQFSDSGKSLKMNKGVDIDLSSTQQNITLGEKLFKNVESVTIDSGGEQKTFSAGAKVTAAEYIACKQMLIAGKQSVQLDGVGRAVGGEVDLSALTSRGDKMRVDDLFIPTNLVTYGDVSKRATFQVTGDLTNAGSMYVYSSSKNANKGFLKADNITNEQTGLISTALSDTIATEHGSSQSNLDLDIHADGVLTNHGIIESSGGLKVTASQVINTTANLDATKPVLKANADLNISAPHVVNNGLIQSTNSNVNIDSAIGSDLNIQNTGGVISAVNGSINLRTPGYNGTNNTNLTGGDLLSKSLNINAGLGTADIDVNELTGVINEAGLASHVKASTETLNLGTICLTGDPTYKNDAGSIVLTGDITVGEALTIIASQHIYNTAPLTITAGNATTGFPITLLAGADITSAGTNTATLPSGNGGTATTISGMSSATGGNINLSTLGGGSVTINSRNTNTKAATANGANILLVAYNPGVSNTAGSVILTGSFLNSGGRGTGNNGNITIFSDGRDTAPFDAVQTGNLNTSGGSSGGAILINCIRPSTSNGNPVTYNANGTLNGSNEITSGSVVQNNASVRIDGNLTAYTSISVYCGGGGGDVIDIREGVQLKSISPLSGVNLFARFASDVVQGKGSLINAVKLNMYTSDGGFGTLANPITTNAKNIEINANNLVSDVFINDTNTGIITLDATAVNLTMTAAGSIVSAAGATIMVPSLNLKSTGGSLGVNKDIPLEVNSFTVQFAAKNDVFVHNDYNGATALSGINSAGGLYSVKTDGDITNNASLVITAPQVDLNTAGGFQAVFNPLITSSKSISLTSVSNITNAFVNTANMTTPLLVLTSTNNIGTSAINRFTLAPTIGGVKATALNTFLNATAVTKKGFNLAGVESGELDLLSAGSVNVTGDVNTSTNDIKITTATGFISVKPAVKLTSHRDLTLQVTDTSATASKSKILLGKGATLQTLAATAGLGNILLSVGTLGIPVFGKAPTKSFAYAENNGVVYFGTGGISAKSALNTMYAKGANIVVNNPFKASNVALAGNVKIIADPPVASEDFTWIISGRNESGAAVLPNANLDSMTTTLGLTNQSWNAPLMNTTAPNVNADLAQMNSTRNATLDSFAPLNIKSESVLAAFGSEDNIEDDSFVTTHSAHTEVVGSTLCAAKEIGGGIPSTERFKPLEASAELKSGHSVFVATRDTELTSSFGKVNLKEGSVVLVSNQNQSLSVYNLHDNRKSSVVVNVSGQEYCLAPGQHLTVASTHAEDFSSVNAIEPIAHRTVKTKAIRDGISIFTSEFSVPTAFDSVSSLKSITSSSHPQIQKLKNKMIKTAAVLMYLGGSQNDFQLYAHPQVTALNPKF